MRIEKRNQLNDYPSIACYESAVNELSIVFLIVCNTFQQVHPSTFWTGIAFAINTELFVIDLVGFAELLNHK